MRLDVDPLVFLLTFFGALILGWVIRGIEAERAAKDKILVPHELPKYLLDKEGR